MKQIKFSTPTAKPYGCFSNFYHNLVVIDGVEWPTIEHYFQAQKFPDHPEAREEIRLAKTPKMAKSISFKKYSNIFNAEWWDTIKIDIMYLGLKHKFSCNEELKNILISTKDAILIEYSKKDSYWGNGGDGSGKNMLGNLLMKLRAELVAGK